MSVVAPSRRVFGLFAVAILASGIAAADTIVVTGTGDGESFWIDENGTPTDVSFAGIIDITLDGTYKRTTMCVQLFTDISENVTYNTTVLLPSQVNWQPPPPTDAALEQIAWLLDNEEAGANTNAKAAGLQLAIWKIAEDGVYTGGSNPFGSGSVTVSTGTATNATVLADATAYLTDATGKSSDLAFVYVNTATSGSPPTPEQMLEGLEFSGGPQPPPLTPECSTFILAGVALLALGRTARRKLGSR
jgi:hypothetical protein